MALSKTRTSHPPHTPVEKPPETPHDSPSSLPRDRNREKIRDNIAAVRDTQVPLRHKMGTAWDVANAALFLASDEANFITGAPYLLTAGVGVQVG